MFAKLNLIGALGTSFLSESFSLVVLNLPVLFVGDDYVYPEMSCMIIINVLGDVAPTEAGCC